MARVPGAARGITHASRKDTANALEPVIGTGELPESTARSLVRLLARQANAQPASVRRLARALVEAGYASGPEAATLHALSSG